MVPSKRTKCISDGQLHEYTDRILTNAVMAVTSSAPASGHPISFIVCWGFKSYFPPKEPPGKVRIII